MAVLREVLKNALDGLDPSTVGRGLAEEIQDRRLVAGLLAVTTGRGRLPIR